MRTHYPSSELLGVVALLVITCQSCPCVCASDLVTGNLVITPDIELGTDDEGEYFFGRVSSVIEDSQGHIYVADTTQMCVFKFRADGEFVERLGSAGGGPGDLMPYFTLGIDSQDCIYFAGVGGRVEIVDTEWNPIGTFTRVSPGEMASSVVVLADGSIVVSCANTTNHTTLDLYNASHEYVKSFSDTYAADREVDFRIEGTYAGGSITAIGADRLVFLQNAPFLIRLFDFAGTLMASTTAGGEDFVTEPPAPEISGDRITFKLVSNTTGVAPLHRGKFLVSAFRRDPEGEVEILLCAFDLSLQLLGRKIQKEKYFIAGSARNGMVYFTHNGEHGKTVIRAAVEHRMHN